MKPLVSIVCLTYNHERYIAQAIEGFVMQKTDFDYEIIIHDDASQDGTAEIIKKYENKYPQLIKPIYQKENQASKERGRVTRLAFAEAQGKYIALCEGDDYWTDPLKLQKQVDFLEENPEYTLTCHRYKIYNSTTKEYSPDFEHKFFEDKKSNVEINLETFFNHWITITLSIVFRAKALEINEFKKYKYFMDIYLYYHLLLKGKGYAFNDIMGVYNKHEGSIWSSLNDRKKQRSHIKILGELFKFNKADPYLEKKYNTVLNKYQNTITSSINIQKAAFLSPTFYHNLITLGIYKKSIKTPLKIYIKSYKVFLIKTYNYLFL
jgi:glycosyltransferase involved in cell wall biosynthesis